MSRNELRKHINNDLKPTIYKWLSEVGSNIIKQTVKEAEKEFQSFLSVRIKNNNLKNYYFT